MTETTPHEAHTTAIAPRRPAPARNSPIVTALSGWRLTWALVFAIAIFATIAATAVGGAGGANLGIRITARTSAVLFLLAFTASSLYQLWPTATTKWIRRNRRYLGVAFAGSHAVHAVFIVATIILNAQRFQTGADHTPHAIYVVDFIAYGFIIAMTITSFEASRIGCSTGIGKHCISREVTSFGSRSSSPTGAAASPTRSSTGRSY